MHEEWVRVSRDHLRAAELLLNEGLYHLVSFHAQRCELRQLREENRKLKQVVADLTLDKQILKEALGKKW